MSPNHNNGGLHGCTGNVLPPKSYCGQAVGDSSARSIGKGRIRRGCEPLARAGGADRMAAIRSARKPSRRRRDERNGRWRAAAPQRLNAAEKSDRRGNGRGGDHDYPNQQGDCSMESDDGRLIARFQRLTTELLAEKRLGQWHPELVDELYRTSLELDERGLKQTPEYRNALLRADEQAWRLVEWARLSGSDAPAPPTAPAEQPDAPTRATDSPPAAPAEQPDASTQPTDSPPAASVHED